jgi:hypothetical protein
MHPAVVSCLSMAQRALPGSGVVIGLESGGDPHSSFRKDVLSRERAQNVKLYTQNVFQHGTICCGPSCFECVRVGNLLPPAVPRLAEPLDGQ